MILRKASLLKVGDKIHIRWWNEVTGVYEICQRQTDLVNIHLSVKRTIASGSGWLSLMPDDLVEMIPVKP